MKGSSDMKTNVKIKFATGNKRRHLVAPVVAFFAAMTVCFAQESKKPNILFIMGDDIVMKQHEGE